MTGVDPAVRDHAIEVGIDALGYLDKEDGASDRDCAAAVVVDALLANPGALRALADTTPAPDVAAAIVDDEDQQHDALDDGFRPSDAYLRGYRAATKRAAEIARELLDVSALPEEDRRVDPRRDRWVTWTTASPTGVDDRHRGVFVAEAVPGLADVVEDEGSPRCIPIANLTFEEDRRG